MQITLNRYDDPAAFARDTFPFLARNEAMHNIFFGVTDTLIRHPERYPRNNLLCNVTRGDEVVAAAFRTPPHNLAVSRLARDDAASLIAELAFETYGELPGLLSTPESADPFLDEWERLTGIRGGVRDGQRIYALEEVVPVDGVRGDLRRAEESDRDRLLAWAVEFHLEAMEHSPYEAAEAAMRAVDTALEDGTLYIWMVDGEPVSMSGAHGPTPNGIRISYVFTPPENRRSGYASACVAAVSQRMLDAGRSFCFLFTDLGNPTSNHIYQEIGYEPVCDMHVYGLGDG